MNFYLKSVRSFSIIKGVWNFSKNRPDFIVIDPRYFFFDLSVRRWGDIRYAIEVTALTKAEFFSRVEGKNNSIQYDKKIADKVRFGSFPKWLTDKEDTSIKLSEDVKKVLSGKGITNDQISRVLKEGGYDRGGDWLKKNGDDYAGLLTFIEHGLNESSW